MKQLIYVLGCILVVSTLSARDQYFRGRKNGHGIHYGTEQVQMPMTRYYQKKDDIHDLWFEPKWEPLREVTFPKWEYEMPEFKNAQLECRRVYKQYKSVIRTAPKITNYSRKEPICGYKQATEAVYEYEEYTKPSRVRRKPLPKHFSRRKISRFTEHRNY